MVFYFGCTGVAICRCSSSYYKCIFNLEPSLMGLLFSCHGPLHPRPNLLSLAQCLFKKNALRLLKEKKLVSKTIYTHPSYARSIIFQCRTGFFPPHSLIQRKRGIIYIHSLKNNYNAFSPHSLVPGTGVCFVEADCPLQGREVLKRIFQAVIKTRQLGC